MLNPCGTFCLWALMIAINMSIAICQFTNFRHLEKKAIQHFSKLAEFTDHYQIANDWTCFVEHKLQHPSDSFARVVLWYRVLAS